MWQHATRIPNVCLTTGVKDFVGVRRQLVRAL